MFLFLEAFFDLGHGIFVGELAVHKTAIAWLLHDLGSRVSRELAEAIIAVDNRIVNDPGVGQHEAAVCR